MSDNIQPNKGDMSGTLGYYICNCGGIIEAVPGSGDTPFDLFCTECGKEHWDGGG